MMLTRLLKLEDAYLSGRINLREYTIGISRLVLSSAKRLAKRDPFQNYPAPVPNGQSDVDYFKRLSLDELNKMLYSNRLFK